PSATTLLPCGCCSLAVSPTARCGTSPDRPWLGWPFEPSSTSSTGDRVTALKALVEARDDLPGFFSAVGVAQSDSSYPGASPRVSGKRQRQRQRVGVPLCAHAAPQQGVRAGQPARPRRRSQRPVRVAAARQTPGQSCPSLPDPARSRASPCRPARPEFESVAPSSASSKLPTVSAQKAVPAENPPQPRAAGATAADANCSDEDGDAAATTPRQRSGATPSASEPPEPPSDADFHETSIVAEAAAVAAGGGRNGGSRRQRRYGTRARRRSRLRPAPAPSARTNLAKNPTGLRKPQTVTPVTPKSTKRRRQLCGVPATVGFSPSPAARTPKLSTAVNSNSATMLKSPPRASVQACAKLRKRRPSTAASAAATKFNDRRASSRRQSALPTPNCNSAPTKLKSPPQAVGSQAVKRRSRRRLPVPRHRWPDLAWASSSRSGAAGVAKKLSKAAPSAPGRARPPPSAVSAGRRGSIANSSKASSGCSSPAGGSQHHLTQQHHGGVLQHRRPTIVELASARAQLDSVQQTACDLQVLLADKEVSLDAAMAEQRRLLLAFDALAVVCGRAGRAGRLFGSSAAPGGGAAQRRRAEAAEASEAEARSRFAEHTGGAGPLPAG
uniref:PHD-type domain-containing protein n=1 Tax=Macrostomum lignano TaxID=282301 RepID=A0A1I8JQF9_9PLAT